MSAAQLADYRRFSLYNSPYPAHDSGCAIDLYPAAGAPSPVAGEVVATRTVRAPTRPYAAEFDHLIVIDTGPHLARILHVDPTVEPGDSIDVGQSLGETVRSGYFAPWVDNHLHLGFRPHGSDPVRATGSIPVSVDVDITPVDWSGTGTVIERSATSVILDSPTHPAPGGQFAGIKAGDGVLDGGLPHYSGGGLLGGSNGAVSLAATIVGTARDQHVQWADVVVRANDTPVTGISFAIHRDRLGVKLVAWDSIPAAVGEPVTVTIQPRSPNA